MDRDIQDLMQELKCDPASSKDIHNDQAKGSSPLIRESSTFYRIPHPGNTCFQAKLYLFILLLHFE